MKKAALLTLLAGTAMSASVNADDITIAGQAYKNVLLTKTSSFYYVQFPDEGRTLSVPLKEVDASTVKINNDPYYRDPLKQKYDASRKLRAAGEIKDVDPAFRASRAEGGAAPGAADGAGGGGGAAGGFGIARTDVEATLAGFGFKFEPSPGNGSSVAKRPDGSLELVGPPDSLKGIVAKSSGPIQAVDAGAQQMQMFMMQLAPEAGPIYMKALGEAKEKGSASASVGPVKINITRKVNGPNADMEVRITGS